MRLLLRRLIEWMLCYRTPQELAELQELHELMEAGHNAD